MNSHAIRKACKNLCEALGPEYAVGKRVDETERYGDSSISIPIINKSNNKKVGKIEALATRTVALYAAVTVDGDPLWIESRNGFNDEPFSNLRSLLLETINTATIKAQKLTGRTPSQAKRVVYVYYGDE
jgi:hypothetical protein